MWSVMNIVERDFQCELDFLPCDARELTFVFSLRKRCTFCPFGPLSQSLLATTKF